MATRRVLLAAATATVSARVLGSCDSEPAAAPPSPRPATRLAVRPAADRAPAARRPVEFTVDTDGVWSNPYDPGQVDLRVTLTGPSGATLTVPAFWYQGFTADGARPDGPAGWRARATVPVPGEWSVRAALSAPNLRSADLSLPVGAAPPRARGFLRLDRDRTGFGYDDGTPFIPVGANIGWSRGSNVLGDYERWFSRLAAAGGNATRVWMAPWSFSVEWSDTPLGDYTNRLHRAWQLDRVFDLAGEHGIGVMLTLLNHGQFSETTNAEWADNPYNKAKGGPLDAPAQFVTDESAQALFARRLRYVAARWAAEPALWAWEWWNEVNWTPIDDAALAPWMQRMTAVLRANDPHRHLITHSYGSGGTSEIWRLPELDFATTHVYSGDDPRTQLPGVAADERSRAAGKPVVLAEYGAGGQADDANVDPEGIHWHTGLWAAPFAGFAGPAMYWWWDEYLDPRELWSQARGIAAFLTGERLARYAPVSLTASTGTVAMGLRAPDRVLAWVRAADYTREVAQRAYEDALRAALRKGEKLTGYAYQPPAVRGARLTVPGPAGAWTARWLSTTDGAAVAVVPVRSATLDVPPFTRDIALKLERT